MGRYKQSTLDAMSDDERRRRHLKVRVPRQLNTPRANVLTVRFDDETMQQVTDLAKRFKQSRTQMARDLIEWGIESVRFEDSLGREEGTVRNTS